MNKYDVIVVGGGHAGIEAALASSRLGAKTILFTISLDAIGLMPCNPNIGGTSKGHLVREIDALGGEMGKNIDRTYIQSKMLNTGKGPAVHSLRAQADKLAYQKEIKKVVENTKNLEIRQNEVIDIHVENNEIRGVYTETNAYYQCKSLVLATGTYLKSRCLYGNVIVESGPNGLKNALKLEEKLKAMGITLYRFKTGTPARIDKKTVDFSKMEAQYGDENVIPFSFENDALEKKDIPCYLTYTNKKTHEIIKKNLKHSPIYSGTIEGTGTRYCPSIEDKIVRFEDKERHQVFIEPEGEDTNEMYVGGMSTSMPENVQIEMYRSVAGMENVNFTRTGYAIEYSCIDATQLKLTLEFKNIKGLYSAGQFNGSSGYEEAAAQGIVAGINGALRALGKEEIIIDRSQGYIGVLIDDLVTKGTKEPYRMMTSRAEYRLLLRQDNADIRLTPIGYKIGLIREDRYNKLQDKIHLIEEELTRIENITISPKVINTFLEKKNSTLLNSGAKLKDLIKRPELDYYILADFDETRPELPLKVKEQVNISIKYEGYINRQVQQVAQYKRLESKLLPLNLDYEKIDNLRIEARQKLNKIRPLSIGHASRITGVSPADINVLMIYLESKKDLYNK
ncbi:MAG: tRNA uridine-5-carboxymethylaminomethyl(34) synthesis enzyme MnmG [Lachnospirales bacterium]